MLPLVFESQSIGISIGTINNLVFFVGYPDDRGAQAPLGLCGDVQLANLVAELPLRQI